MSKPEWYSWTRDNITHTLRLADVVAMKEVRSPGPSSIYLRGGQIIDVGQDVAAAIKAATGATKT